MVKIGSRATFSSRIAGNRFFGGHAKSIHPTLPIEGSLERSRHYGHFELKIKLVRQLVRKLQAIQTQNIYFTCKILQKFLIYRGPPLHPKMTGSGLKDA